jgi:hypothetical protein
MEDQRNVEFDFTSVRLLTCRHETTADITMKEQRKASHALPDRAIPGNYYSNINLL